MIHPSTYYQLIYYQRIKLVSLVTFMLLVMLGFIIILALVNYFWSKYVADVIVIGNGPFAQHFHNLLREAGLTSCLVLPPRQYQLSCAIDNLPAWSRVYQPDIIFPEPSQEELGSLAEQYGLSVDQIKTSWQYVSGKAYKYPQHEAFFTCAENLGTQERQVYTLQLQPSNHHEYHRVVSIEQDSRLAKVEVDNRGDKLYARLACLVEVSQENLFERYHNLDQPLGARLIQSYVSTDVEKEDVGSFFETETASFRYHRRDGYGSTLLSTDVEAKFQAETGLYQLSLPEIPLHETLELNELPNCSFRVSHLFFPWLQQDKSPLILDTVNIRSTSPERDLVIVMQGLVNTLTYTKNALQ